MAPIRPVYTQAPFEDDDPHVDVDSTCGSEFSEASLISFNSERDFAKFLRDYEGRTFNAQNELYFLPADEPEFNRLDKQHLMLLLALKGLYPVPEAVRRVLSPEVGRQKTVLDIGTGGGNWAISMAMEFPHILAVGIDLAPSTTRPLPPNCRFEFDDVSLGIPHYHGSFDVVHARSCGTGIKDYKALIDEIALCLRPGGLAILAEGDFDIRGEDGEPLQPAYIGDEVGKSWFRRVLIEVESTNVGRGVSMECPKILQMGLDYHPAFEKSGGMTFATPCGPWKMGSTPEETRILSTIGILMRQNSREFVRACRPMLLTRGFSRDQIHLWISEVDRELTSMNPKTSVLWRYAWGTKKSTTTTTSWPANSALPHNDPSSFGSSMYTMTSTSYTHSPFASPPSTIESD